MENIHKKTMNVLIKTAMMVAVRKNKTEEGATTGAAVFMIYAKIQKNTRPAKPPQQPAVAVPDRRAAPIPTKQRIGKQSATKGKAPPRKANRTIADFARNARKGVHPDGKNFSCISQTNPSPSRQRPAPTDGIPPTPRSTGTPAHARCPAMPCGVRQRTLRRVLEYLPQGTIR